MSSTSETGHYKNVAEFGRLVDAIGTIDAYNPTRADLQLGKLRDIFNAAKTIMEEEQETETIYKSAIKLRSKAFDSMQLTATRIYNSLVSANEQSPLLPAAKAYIDKLRGERRTELPKPDEKTGVTPATISVSQQSFDAQLEHLKGLVSTVKGEPAYQPNEAEVSVTAISQLVQDLTTLNKNASNASTAMESIREQRQRVLYAEPGGLVPVALAVKKYLVGAFGTQSAELKLVSGFHFAAHS